VIVLDASATLEVLFQSEVGRRIEARMYAPGETLLAPHLLDLEVTSALRRLARAGLVSVERAEEALAILLDLRIIRYPHYVFLSRVWQYRHNLSAYDAVYVALTEALGASLITCDARLASAPATNIKVELF
jgi:predicted nucleic acid-binding protein